MKQTEHRANTSTSMPKTCGALETNKTLKPCKYDYASFFKYVTPNHSLLARCKFATFSVYDKQTSNGRLVAETRSMTPKHTLLWKHRANTGTSLTKTWGALETNKTLKPCKYDYASFFKRVPSKHSLLARCKFTTSSIYDKQTCT